MVAVLPLDSPLWGQLSACYSAENAIALLRQIVAARELGEAWHGLREEILHQGTVYGVSSAVIPHLVEIAPHLDESSKRALWIEIGFLVTAGADHFSSPPAPGLQEGLTGALDAAQAQAVRDFLADATLAPGDASYYALACIALAGHRASRAMWRFPSPGYVDVGCPGCGARYEVDGFTDPFALPCPVPVFKATPKSSHAWRDAANAIEQASRAEALGPGWDAFLDTARRVALAGVPPEASSAAAWCLVAAMVGTKSQASVPWARTLARLAGHVRCPGCDKVWAIADTMDDEASADPVDVASMTHTRIAGQGVLFEIDHDGAARDRLSGGTMLTTIADGITGFLPSPHRTLGSARVSAQVAWRADGDPVDTLTAVAGQAAAIAVGGGEGVRLLDPASGMQARPILPGPAVAVASLPLPDGGSVIAASGDDGSLRWWDASAGRLLDGMVIDGAAPGLSLAAVLLPAGHWKAAKGAEGIPGRLAEYRDGRTMLATGDADGVVRLWDPMTRAAVTDLYRHPGRRVISLTSVNFVNQPPWNGTDLVAVYGDLLVDVWGSASVHGRLSDMAPRVDKLAAAGHERIIGGCTSPNKLGHRRPVLLADRNGTVSLWETFGVRLSDPLPPDPAHRDVIGIAVLPGPGDGITVVTASRTDSSLRAWQPLRGTATLLPLSIEPRCMITADDCLLIGHDGGLLALSLAFS